jgi:DNA-binding CsgD family transcriptional regulator
MPTTPTPAPAAAAPATELLVHVDGPLAAAVGAWLATRGRAGGPPGGTAPLLAVRVLAGSPGRGAVVAGDGAPAPGDGAAAIGRAAWGAPAPAPPWLRPADARLLGLVARGASNPQLGRALHLTRHGVDHRLERLCRLTGAANRTELAAWAGVHGLYHPAEAEAPAPAGAPRPRRAVARRRQGARRARPRARLR